MKQPKNADEIEGALRPSDSPPEVPVAVPVPDDETPSDHTSSSVRMAMPLEAETQPAVKQAATATNEAPVELRDIAKLVLMLGGGLGVISAALMWCIAMFLSWVPAMILGPGVLFGAISLVKLATLLININWLSWVTAHGVRWNLAIRCFVRLAAVVMVPVGFYLFYGILKPSATPWLSVAIEQKASDDEEIMKAVSRKLRAHGDLRFHGVNGTMMPQERAEIASIIEVKMREEHGLWLSSVIAVSVGLQVTLGSVLLWSSLLGWNAAKRSALFHQRRPLSVQDAAGEVVFFRSFAADAAPAALEGVWSSFVFKSEEELLAEAMPRGTRFFAIGRPGEPLPEVGAERLYFRNEEWEAAALQLMSNAALVIVRPHQTPSLIWELRQIIATVPPQRVLIWVPPSMLPDEWIAFQEAVKESFRPDLPGVDKLANFITFAPDWTSSAFSLASEAETMKSGQLYRPPPEGKKLVAAQLVALLKRARAS